MAGLDTATSTSRSSSVARRLTNVVLARRSVVGSRPSARASAAFSAPIAAAVSLALPTSCGQLVAALGDRGDRARGVDQELRQRRLVLGHLLHEPARAGEDRVEVLRGLAGLFALARVLDGEALDHVGQVAACLLVERVEDLVEVDHVGGRLGTQRGALGQLLGVTGRRGQRDVAVGDAAQRREPDDRLRALPQRRVGLLDDDLDRRLVVVGQLDLAHRADAAAADLHVVVDDELAGALEQQRVLGAAGAAEQQQPDDQAYGQRERYGRGRPCHRHR